MFKTFTVFVFVVASAALSGCLGLFFPFEVHEYYPKARWGSATSAGGCPSHTPALEVNAKTPDWLSIRVGIWDSEQTKMRKLKEPTLFIHFVPGWHLSIQEQQRRRMAVIPLTSQTPYLDILLADGERKRIPLDIFNHEYIWGMTASTVPINASPQSMTVNFPDLLINGELVRLGEVQFMYRKATRYPC
jgi:hypothetical protein